MKTLLKLLAAMGLATFGLAGPAMAEPASSCRGDGTTGNPILCDLFEENANGAPSELGWDIPLGGPVSTGVVLIVEQGGDPANRADWSDEILFLPDDPTNPLSLASHVRLISDGCDSGVDGDLSCFLDPVNSTPIFEDANGIAIWNVGNVYTVHSDSDVPEPATLALLGAAFAGIGFARRRRQLH